MPGNALQIHILHVTKVDFENLILYTPHATVPPDLPFGFRCLFAVSPRPLDGDELACCLHGAPPNDAMDERAFDHGACDQATPG